MFYSCQISMDILFLSILRNIKFSLLFYLFWNCSTVNGDYVETEFTCNHSLKNFIASFPTTVLKSKSVLVCATSCILAGTCKSMFYNKIHYECNLYNKTFKDVTKLYGKNGTLYFQRKGGCTNGYINAADVGLCFKTFMQDKRRNFTNAKLFCESEGGRLIKLDTKEKEDFINKYVKTIMEVALSSYYFFSGMTYDHTNGKWIWSDGSPVIHPTWGYHQTGYDCGGPYYDGGGWSILSCKGKENYICEIPIT